MVSKEVKGFLAKLNPFVEKFPEIADKVSKLNDDKEFQNLLGRLGTIGGLFSIGLYIFDKTLENSSDSEKTCYSLINKTAIDVAGQIIKESEGITEDKQNNEELLKQMLKIYSFKETEKEKYQNWNGIPVDHPIVEEFRKRIFQIIKENNLESIYPNFVTEFNVKFQDKIQAVDKFKDCQKQTKLKNTSKERSDYLRWILKELDKPHPIDKRKTTEYYDQNRAIEFDLEEGLYHNKDYWNMSDSEIEEYSKTIKNGKLMSFYLQENLLNSLLLHLAQEKRHLQNIL